MLFMFWCVLALQFYEDSCLLRQKFVMADDQTVQVTSQDAVCAAHKHMHSCCRACMHEAHGESQA